MGNIADKNKTIHFRPIGECHEPHCFNGHAFLEYGNITEVGRDTTYVAMRDRRTADGNWLSKECSEFFSSKLYDNNIELTDSEKEKTMRDNKNATRTVMLRKAFDKVRERLRKKR